MALRGFVIYLVCIAVCTFLPIASALTLPNLVTQKPRHTKYTTPPPAPAKSGVTPAAPAVAPTVPGVSVYRFTDSKGATCILLRTDALVEISFKSSVGEEKGDSYLPDNALIEGDCSNEDKASIRIMWTGYSLVMTFAKTPGGERWYISRMELTASTDLPQYHNIKTRTNSIKLIHTTMALPTPVGKSFSCDETIIKFSPNPEDTLAFKEGLSGTLYLRALRLQPFMYKGNDFGPSFECNASLGFRDETAPIAVGSTLAIAVLLTVAGYGVFRYFKIKKVQYNTME